MFSLLWGLLCPAPKIVTRGYLMISVHLNEKRDAVQLLQELTQLQAEFVLAVQKWCRTSDRNRSWKFEFTPSSVVDTAGVDAVIRIAGHCSESKSAELVLAEFTSLCDTVIPELRHVVYGPQICCELQLDDGTMISPSLHVSAAAAYAAFA